MTNLYICSGCNTLAQSVCSMAAFLLSNVSAYQRKKVAVMLEHLCTAQNGWKMFEHVSDMDCGCVQRSCFKCNMHIIKRPEFGCNYKEEVKHERISNKGRTS
jgi:hypothetical protein